MKKIIVLLLAVCLLTAILSVPAEADQKIVNKVESKEELSHSSTIYLGEVSIGGNLSVKYIYSEDLQLNSVIYQNLSAALGAMEDKDYATLLKNYYNSLTEPTVGVKACSVPLLAKKMDSLWKYAKNVAEMSFSSSSQLYEINGDVYDLDEGFKNECDKQSKKRADEINYPITTDKRIISDLDVNSSDSVYYTTEDGQIVKHVDTFVTYSAEATSVVYTAVKPKNDVSTFIPGDVDGNGKVDSTDYIIIKRHILKISELTGNAFAAADMDGSGALDATDYIAVKRIILGLA